jgi:signal transduction histidine kinase
MSDPAGGPALFVRFAVGTATFGVALTSAVVVARARSEADGSGLGVLTVDDLHEGQLETAAAMLLMLTAAVLWGRLQRRPTWRNLLLFAALCVLALDNLVSALFTAGFDSLSANTFATWSTAWNGLVGALLLAVASRVVDLPLDQPRRATPAVLGACAGLIAVSTVVAWSLRDLLPHAFDVLPTTAQQVTLLNGHSALLWCQVATAACWAVAGISFTAAATRTRDELTGWIGLGSVLAALAFVNYTLFPSQYTELLYLGDFFYLLAVVVLTVGAVREIGEAESALVGAVLYSERRRIAREIHDGVAQELALIAAEAQSIARRPETATSGLDRIRSSVDRALDESRTAISQLSGPVDESLAAALSVAAQVVARRTGARVELALDESVVVSPDTRLALTRVTRDAVAHAVKHHGAQTVRVALWREGTVRLQITDDGRGTDGTAGEGTQWLTAIRERIDAVFGQLDVHHGTEPGHVVEVRVP